LLVPGVEKSDAEFEWICVLSTATFFAKVVRSPIKEIEQKVTMTTKKEWFNDKPSARLRKFSFPFSVFRFWDFFPSYSRYSFDSWFTIFAFSEQSVIHESNAVSEGFA